MVACLLIMAIAAVVFLRQATLQSIRESSHQHNEVLTRAFIHSLWPQFQHILESHPDVSGEGFHQKTDQINISAEVLALIRDTPTLKLKLYDQNGVVQYSTDHSEIGTDDSANPRLRRSLAGETITVFRDHPDFRLFDRIVEGRELLVSYIPIIGDGAEKPVRAVFELYYDMSPTLDHISLVTMIVFAALLAMGFVVASAYRAPRIMPYFGEVKVNWARYKAFLPLITGFSAFQRGISL